MHPPPMGVVMSPPNALYSSVEPERVNTGAVRTALSEVAPALSGSSIVSFFDLQFRDSVYKHLASGDRMVMPLTSPPWLVERLPVVGGQPGGAREGS